ncbi:hypothetical protein DLK05_11380 [Ancylomarina longa]|uniref:Uncharacterized protein n=1 Tax=Ancylomarina longa TaxID=2487017 RepID=A0A434ATW6_9BACT|nr:hypothetical protein DLK05_11380 [Ancylomarina longa]
MVNLYCQLKKESFGSPFFMGEMSFSYFGLKINKPVNHFHTVETSIFISQKNPKPLQNAC